MTGLDPLVLLIVRMSFVLLFGAAALHKLSNRNEFRSALEGYGVVPTSSVSVITRILPLFELVAVAALLIEPIFLVGMGFVLLLLTSYSIVIAAALINGNVGGDCGCGFTSARLLGWPLVVRNLVLLVFAGLLWLPPTARELVTLDFFTLVVALVSAGFLWTAGERLGSTSSEFADKGAFR